MHGIDAPTIAVSEKAEILVSVIEPIRFTLLNGTAMNVRTALEQDTVPLLELIREVLQEKDHFGVLPEEFRQTEDKFRKLINATTAAPADIHLVAETSETIIGFLEFYADERQRLAHGGTVTLFVKKDYRQKGVGTFLFRTLFDWAEATPMVEKISLTLLSNNVAAAALYRKMGFEVEGRRAKAIKLTPDIYVDELLMSKWVK